MPDEAPSYLLYLLTVGREHELVLRVSGPAPTEDDLMSWMRDAAVQALRVSRHGHQETFTFMVNFGHVVGARIAPYSESHTASF
jgi:hypothetical protein